MRRRVVAILGAVFAMMLVFTSSASADTYTWSSWVRCNYNQGGYTNIHWQLHNTGVHRRVRLFGWGNGSPQPAQTFAVRQTRNDTGAMVGGTYHQSGAPIYAYQTGDMGSTLLFLDNDIAETFHVVLVGTNNRVCDYAHAM